MVGRLLVWLELERAYVVRSHLERFVMVGQNVERKDVVGSHLERIRLVGRLVGRGRRSSSLSSGAWASTIWGTDGRRLRSSPSHAAGVWILTTALFALSVLLWFAEARNRRSSADPPPLWMLAVSFASRKCS